MSDEQKKQPLRVVMHKPTSGATITNPKRVLLGDVEISRVVELDLSYRVTPPHVFPTATMKIMLLDGVTIEYEE